MVLEMISTAPILLFKNATARLNGNYECQVEDMFGIVRFYRIDIYVDGECEKMIAFHATLIFRQLFPH